MPKRTKNACTLCGKEFYGGTSDSLYCPECARKKKIDTVFRIRVCKDCGVEFFGGPRAKRCPDCAYKAKQETGRRHKVCGTLRPLGSIDKCQMCGRDYVVNSGRQKYCQECRREAVLSWQREHKKIYIEETDQNAKRRERRKQIKKSAFIVCGLLQVARLQIFVPIFAGKKIKN